jgi:GAF domain-containing protein
VTGQLDRDTLFGKIIQHSMALFGADSVGIWMPVEGEALELMAAVGEVQAQRIGQRLSKGEGLSGKVLDTGRALRVEDYQAWTGHAESFKDASIQAALSVPMIGQGRVVGVLALTRAQVGQPFSVDDERIMQLLAAQAASALTNTDLAEEQRRTLEELDTINRRLTGEAWTKQLERTAGGVQLINYARRGQHTAGPDWLPEVEMAVMSKKPVAWSQREGQSGGSPFQAALAAPIVLRGEVIGALQVGEAGQARAWSTDEMNFIQAVADQVALAVENARLIEETERRAQREQLISEISRKMLAANDMRGIIQAAGDELGRALQVSRAEVKIGTDTPQSATETNPTGQSGGRRQETPK